MVKLNFGGMNVSKVSGTSSFENILRVSNPAFPFRLTGNKALLRETLTCANVETRMAWADVLWSLAGRHADALPDSDQLLPRENSQVPAALHELPRGHQGPETGADQQVDKVWKGAAARFNADHDRPATKSNIAL